MTTTSMTSSTDGFRLVVPTFTPFDADGAILPERVPDYANWLKRRGIGEVFANGTSGEFASLTVAENRTMAAAWCAQPGLQVIVHVGHVSAMEARGLATHAQENGAAGIAAVPPFYFKPADLESLVDVMAIIAAGAPDLPFYYYHIPGLTGVHAPMWRFIPLAIEAIPTFAGVKYTYEDLSDYRLSLDAAGDDYEIFFGRDEMLLSAVAAGARSGVGTMFNLMPEAFLEIAHSHGRGDHGIARQTQATASALVEIAKEFAPLPALKAMMAYVGFDCGPCRPPLARIEGATRESLMARLTTSGLTPGDAGGQ